MFETSSQLPGELPDPPTPGQLLDARHVLDDQTFDALDDQHRKLAARVDTLEATVALFEALMLGDRPVPDHRARPGGAVGG